ncbi:TPA: electron transport complex subunit RsxC [Photobacterium damselae]
MQSIIEQIKHGKLWDFHGGIHPAENKAQSSQAPIAFAGIPHEIVLPLKQHIGTRGDIIVNVGDYVYKGQPLTQGDIAMCVPIHASTSGTITAIEERTTAHPSGLSDLCIVIKPDGKDTWFDLHPVADYELENSEDLINIIRLNGIAGLGGAGFPTARKLQGGLGQVDILIINAAECEPYITADDRLMQDYAEEVIEGVRILRHIVKPQLTIIGIEDNKPDAIKALEQHVHDDDNILIRVVPTKYPSGSSKQLVKILTGREVPSGSRSTSVGVIMQNIGTAFAIKRAIVNGEPLIERVVTLTGDAFSQRGNYFTRLGTPVSYLLDTYGYKADKKYPRVIIGGSLMGFTLPHPEVPITKITNCILTPSRKELPLHTHEMACIRCSSCSDVCPSSLLPQQLQWYAKDKDYDKCEEYNLSDCIECGACAYVCPSEIPLVQYYRQAKAEIWARKQDEINAERARQRFEAKQARMERDKAERENRFKKAADDRRQEMASTGGNDAVAAAIARVKAKQAAKSEVNEPKPAVAAAIARAKAKQTASAQAGNETPDNSEMAKLREERKRQAREHKAAQAESKQTDTSTVDEKQSAVAAAVARAKARKAAQQQTQNEKTEVDTHATSTESDPKKAAVAAAVARAKARKAAQQPAQNEKTEVDTHATSTESDPKKAAVAAAVARAKARKAAQQQAQNEKTEVDTHAASTEGDPKKAAVAAAVARAKARKAAQQQAQNGKTEVDTHAASTESDPKKAAVAAAVARAKARKAAQQQAQNKTTEVDTHATSTESDPKKAAVAAAVARAKARKAAQQQAQNETTEVDTHATSTESDPKKAAVAAAVARAKARKAAQQAAKEQQNEEC